MSKKHEFLNTGYNTAPAHRARNSCVLQKSPTCKVKTKAENKIKQSILGCFTVKAQSLLENLRRERRNKFHSCSTSRNSLGKMNLTTLKSFRSNESSPSHRMNVEQIVSPPPELNFSQPIQSFEDHDSNS